MKNWEDTVMTNKEILEVFRKTPHLSNDAEMAMLGGRAVAQAQAGISFKAGEQIGFAKGVISRVKELSLLNEAEMEELNVQAKVYLDAVKQTGIKEVAEWVDKNWVDETNQTQWQAFKDRLSRSGRE